MTPQEISTARMSLGWTQRSLALAAGLSTAAVVRVERGFPQPPTFFAQLEATLCDAIGDKTGAKRARRGLLPDLTGGEVAAARQALGWKQNDLARWSGTCKGSVSRLESGMQVRAGTRAIIVAALLAAQDESQGTRPGDR